MRSTTVCFAKLAFASKQMPRLACQDSAICLAFLCLQVHLALCHLRKLLCLLCHLEDNHSFNCHPDYQYNTRVKYRHYCKNG